MKIKKLDGHFLFFYLKVDYSVQKTVTNHLDTCVTMELLKKEEVKQSTMKKQELGLL